MKWIMKDGTTATMEKEIRKELVMGFSRADYDIEGAILYQKMSLINGFLNAHRCEIFNVEFELSPIEYNKKQDIVDVKYKRADGQYVYCGKFLSRESVLKEIEKDYRTLTATFHYVENVK